jgi:methionyl-tRNA formyltransferase
LANDQLVKLQDTFTTQQLQQQMISVNGEALTGKLTQLMAARAKRQMKESRGPAYFECIPQVQG